MVDPAEVPFLYVPPERLHVPPLALREGYMNRPVSLLGRPHDAFGLIPRPGERLLAEHVPSALQRRDCDGRVEMVRRPYAHDVQIVAGNKVLPAPVQVAHPIMFAEFPQPLLFQPGQCNGLHVRHPDKVLQVLLSGVAEADHPYTQW